MLDLNQLMKSHSPSVVQLDSGLQIVGLLKSYQVVPGSMEISYLQFVGPTSLQHEGKILDGHNVDTHNQGFGTPVGFLKEYPFKSISNFSASDLNSVGIIPGQTVNLNYESGVHVHGVVDSLIWQNEKLVLIRFSNCTVSNAHETLFQPSWGYFDMSTGSKVTYASL